MIDDSTHQKREGRLSALRSSVEECSACSVRSECKWGKPVPGQGPASDIIFVGRNPSEMEVVARRLLVGPVEHRFNDLLRSVGLSRSTAYVTDVLKCATSTPKDDRAPKGGEVSFCGSRFLSLELATLQPKVVVTLGADAFRFMTKDRYSTCTGQTGMPHDVGETWEVFALFHPAHVLRRPPRRGGGEDVTERDISDREALVVYLENRGLLEEVRVPDLEVVLVR